LTAGLPFRSKCAIHRRLPTAPAQKEERPALTPSCASLGPAHCDANPEPPQLLRRSLYFLEKSDRSKIERREKQGPLMRSSGVTVRRRRREVTVRHCIVVASAATVVRCRDWPHPSSQPPCSMIVFQGRRAGIRIHEDGIVVASAATVVHCRDWPHPSSQPPCSMIVFQGRRAGIRTHEDGHVCSSVLSRIANWFRCGYRRRSHHVQ
jgi:hypothetical protein